MMRLKLCAVVASALVTLGHGAAAQPISKAEDLTNNAAFVRLLKSRPHQDAKIKIAQAEDKSVGRLCADQYSLGDYMLTIREPIVLAEGSVAPKSGGWLERYQVMRCGRQSLFNAHFFVGDDGKLNAQSVGPGESALDARAVIKMRPTIVRSAKIENCRQRGLLDTARGAPEGYEPKEANGIYETWTVTGCGKDIDMVLLFTQTPDGKVEVRVEKQLPR